MTRLIFTKLIFPSDEHALKFPSLSFWFTPSQPVSLSLRLSLPLSSHLLQISELPPRFVIPEIGELLTAVHYGCILSFLTPLTTDPYHVLHVVMGAGRVLGLFNGVCSIKIRGTLIGGFNRALIGGPI